MEQEMASDHELATYLNDHLAGSTAARDLVQRSATQTRGSALGIFLGTLLRDIEEDRSELRSIMRRLDVKEQVAKQAAGAVAERASRVKFDVIDRNAGGLNRVLELESMLMGIEGKAALWRTLRQVAPREPRLAGVDLDVLVARADEQQADVERHRRGLLRVAFS